MTTGGMIIFIGPDGSGKSTIADLALEKLYLEGKIARVEKLHLKPGWLPPLGRLFSPRDWGKAIPVGVPVDNPHASKPSGPMGSMIRLLYYLVDYSLGFRIKIKPLLKDGGSVLFDRYYYDYMIDPARARIRLPKAVLAAFLPLVPKPEIVIYLDAPAEVLRKRKPELPIEELERQIAEFRKLVDGLPYAYRVDADRSMDEVAASAAELIGSHLTRFEAGADVEGNGVR